MATSSQLIDHLSSNVTWCCPIWKWKAKDGGVAAYCQHTRPLTYNSANATATGSLHFNALPLNNETITIGGIAFRFRNTPVYSYDVQIGADVAATRTNLLTAINANTSTLCSAANGVTGTLNLTALTTGEDGNGISLFTDSANVVLVLFSGGVDSVVYTVSSVESTRPVQSLGLQPNSIEISGVFDDIFTRADAEGGRWKKARFRYEVVNYLDLTMGSTQIIEGFLGKVTVTSPVSYKIEFLSKSEALQPLLGQYTSPLDRNVFPTGVSVATYTHTGAVKSVSVSRRKFKIDYVQPEADFLQYGLITFTSGANSGLSMDIKTSATTDGSTRTEIELQLPMKGDIAVNDTVSVIAGYNGTREQMKSRFNDMIDFDGEPDLPGLKGILTYP